MSQLIPPDALAASLARRADLCVKCGLCLPHCPTYRVTRDEADSPRGRIALMQGLASGLLAPEGALAAHLDGCLTCRACETACPAHVPYGALIDDARTLMAQRRPGRDRVAALAARVLASPAWRRVAAAMLWLYQQSGLSALVRRTRLLGHGPLARAEQRLPRIHWPSLPAPAPRAGATKVALFATCTVPMVEPETLDAAVRVLAHLSCDVAVPRGQCCCGALHHHAGRVDPARACAQRNVEAFAGADAVVSVASGCTAELLEYDRLEPGARAHGFGKKVHDVTAFMAGHPGLAQLSLRPLAGRVLLQTPCTLRNVVRRPDSARRLLERIPELSIDEMDATCCGAAGASLITQPAMADALVAAKVEQVRAMRPDYVLSANVGCAMHLSAALRQSGLRVPVWHPVRLLAQQLSG